MNILPAFLWNLFYYRATFKFYIQITFLLFYIATFVQSNYKTEWKTILPKTTIVSF